MSKRETVPIKLAALPRENPLVWQGEEDADGVFLGTSGTDEALALLGTPSLQLPTPPRLPPGFEPSAQLRHVLAGLTNALADAAKGEPAAAPFDLGGVTADDRIAVDEILGQGEVTGEVTLDGVRRTIRESVLTGVWRVTGDDGSDQVEVAEVPACVERAATSLRHAPLVVPEDAPNVMNGASVLAEISERAAAWEPDQGPNHVINFTLLPMSQGDQELLTSVLGRADLTLTSGGFGTCRIMATTVRHVWAVQYLNAMGNTILDTIEIGEVPAAACAAGDDFEDSLQRLREILEAYLS